MALSDDNTMGSDSAIECVKEEELIQAYTSITSAGTGNYAARRANVVS